MGSQQKQNMEQIAEWIASNEVGLRGVYAGLCSDTRQAATDADFSGFCADMYAESCH